MSTIVGREKLDHPALGSAGGSALHLAIETIYTNIGNDNPGRFKAYAAIANSAVTTIDHNYGVDFADLNVYIYTGTHPTLTRVSNPTASGWTIAATSGFLKTKIDVTAPSSGGPHTFVAFIVHGSSSLDFLTDVDLTVAPEDGQALVYEASSTSWKPGASGDASFKIQSVATPNAVIKGGFLLLDNGKELATYDGAGSLSTDFGKDLTVSLTTILGSAPANATAYYLYIDLNSLSAAVTQTDTGRSVYAVTVSNFVLSTIAPEFTDMSRYVPRAVIMSATSGTAWSGAGSSFATLAFLSAQTVDAKIKSSMTLNYIDVSTPERSVGAAITYADAAGVVPVDGTGGAPTVTFTRNTTSPIRGVADYKFSKSAVNSQGQGFSIPFTIPVTDKNIKARIKFRVIATHANYVAGDLGLFVYDVTNSLLITPAVSALPNLSGVYETTFDLTTGVSYRLIGHVTTVSALAYDLYFDDIRVDIEKSGSGAVITAQQAWGTPATANLGTVTNAALTYTRQGTAMIINGTLKVGTPGGSVAALTLPNSLTINSNGHTNGRNVLGYVQQNAAAAGALSNGLVAVLYNSADVTSLYFAAQSDTAASNNTASPENGNAVFNSNATLSFVNIRVEISQWAGSGTLNTGANDVEYAYNTGTNTTGNDTTSFGYGPSGGKFRAQTASLKRRVQWLTPIQKDEEISIEFFEADQHWTPLEYTQYVSANVTQGTTRFGMYLEGVSTTQTDVVFGTKRVSNNTAYDNDATASNWSAIANTDSFKWRAVKRKKGVAVGFGLATETVSGLVKLPSIINDLSTASPAFTQNAYTQIRTVTLTPGTWLVDGVIISTNNSTAGVLTGIISNSNTGSEGFENTDVGGGAVGSGYCQVSCNSINQQFSVSVRRQYITTAPTTVIYLVGRSDISGATWSGRSILRAVSIA